MGLLDLFRSKPQPAPQQPQQPPAVLTEQLQRYDQAFRQLTESNEFPNLFASLYDRYYSNGTWWIPAGGIPMLGGTSNKYQGRDAYISIHEQDNRLIVDACRLLYAREPVAKSIVNYLQCFVLGSGLTYKLCSKKEDAIDESILEAGQEYIDEWCERNEQTEREHECFECSIVDGEFFLWMKVYNGEVVVRRIEPEFIRNPPNMAMEQGWFFGVKYDPLDMETPLAYWYEPPMSKGQEIPADEIIHYKANVTKNVARGVSDFFPVLDDLNGIAGLIDNIRAGATARAEIAYMYSIANATQGAISDFASARRDRTAQNPITNRTDSFKGMSAGKVVYHGQNASFQTMPQGDVQSYIEAAQQSLRLIGNRWCMPEYMVSADASNNNYASSLIAGGPFVRKIEYVQKRFGTSMKRLMEAVVNQAIAGKVIPARYLPMLKVEVTAHSPVIEDKYQQAQTYDIYTRMGAMSVESVASRIGEDYEKVQAENEEHADRMLDQQVAQNDALGGGDQQDSGNGGFAESLQENTLDDSGHMHKGKGPGGGQFTGKGDSGEGEKGQKKLAGKRFEKGKTLSKEDKAKVLKTVVDVYKDNNLEKSEIKGYDSGGDPIYGYPHSPDLFIKSDVTGAKVRHYITLPDGTKAHPSELFPNISQTDIDKELYAQAAEEKRKKQIEKEKLARVASSKGDANYAYKVTNRKLDNSYFATNKDGMIVRVDGNDVEDVEFFSKQGFVRSSDPVVDTAKSDKGANEPK